MTDEQISQPWYDLAWKNGAAQHTSFAGDELEGITFTPDQFEAFCATLAAGSQAVHVPAEATEAMADAVRPLIVAIEIAGRTYGSVRNHCERAGMDLDGWPDWARNEPAGAHFTKAACALLIWHCMRQAAAPLQPLAGGEVGK